MSDYLKSFVNSDGSTTHQGQINAGTHEFNRGFSPAPQQSHESADAYTTRINQHSWLSNNSKGSGS